MQCDMTHSYISTLFSIQHPDPCNLIERNPPPRGGFFFSMFPDQEPGGRGPPLKNHPQNWYSAKETYNFKEPANREWDDTTCCIWSVISSISNLHQRSSSLGLSCHVPLEGDQWDWDWRPKWRDTLNVIGCASEWRRSSECRSEWVIPMNQFECTSEWVMPMNHSDEPVTRGGGLGSRPKKCTGRGWEMGSITI